jgi:hypothetical protein
MLHKILKLEGVVLISKEEQKNVSAGIAPPGDYYVCYCNGYNLGIMKNAEICIENCLWAKC